MAFNLAWQFKHCHKDVDFINKCAFCNFFHQSIQNQSIKNHDNTFNAAKKYQKYYILTAVLFTVIRLNSNMFSVYLVLGLLRVKVCALNEITDET